MLLATIALPKLLISINIILTQIYMTGEAYNITISEPYGPYFTQKPLMRL